MRIALVGGIGCGKSTVGEMLRAMGATVLDADVENAALLQQPDYIRRLGALVPDSVVDGVVHKDIVRAWMLSDPENRAALNRLAHPLLRQRIVQKMPENGVCFVELSAYQPDFLPMDEIWLVTAPREVRVGRIAARNHWTKAEIELMIDAQPTIAPEDCTLVLDNGGNMDLLAETVAQQYKRVCKGLAV